MLNKRSKHVWSSLGVLASIPLITTSCYGPTLGLDKNEDRVLSDDSSSGGLTASFFSYQSTANYFDVFLGKKDVKQVNFRNGALPLTPPNANSMENKTVRFTGYIVPQKSGSYTFAGCADDGIRIYIDGKDAIPDHFADSGEATFWKGAPISLEAGKKYPIKVEVQNGSGEYQFRLLWTNNGSFQLASHYRDSLDVNDDVIPGYTLPGRPYEPVNAARCNGYVIETKGSYTNPTTGQVENNKTLRTDRYTIGNSDWLKYVVPSSVLRPESEDADRELAECKVEPKFLDPDAPAGSEAAPLPVSDVNVRRAMVLFRRLAGINISPLDVRVKQMARLIKQGREKEAAHIATSNPSFYDITVRQMASRLSNRDEVPNIPLNDFIATYIGVTRDGVDARKLLTGSFLYRPKEVFLWAENSGSGAYVDSNEIYSQVDAMKHPLACVLERIKNLNYIPASFRQDIYHPLSGSAPNPDTAGVLTSRAFAEAHLTAGTNRRMIEKSVEHFLCTPIKEWRNANAPDVRVRRDVTRIPSSTRNQYTNECKLCHSVMDPLAGSFAKYDFHAGVIKYAPFFQESSDNPNETNIKRIIDDYQFRDPSNNPDTRLDVRTGANILRKINHNVSSRPFDTSIDQADLNAAGDQFVVPNKVLIGTGPVANRLVVEGHRTLDDSWENTAQPFTQAHFGWNGTQSGFGAGSFGELLANSDQFARCQVQKVYETVCKKKVKVQANTAGIEGELNGLAEQFAKTGYDLKGLFEVVGTLCMEEVE